MAENCDTTKLSETVNELLKAHPDNEFLKMVLTGEDKPTVRVRRPVGPVSLKQQRALRLVNGQL
jgi:hypothetical protein